MKNINKIILPLILASIISLSNPDYIYSKNTNNLETQNSKKEENLKEKFRKKLDYEFRINLWENGVIPKIPLQLIDSLEKDTPLTDMTKNWIDRVKDSTEEAYLDTIGEIVRETKIFNNLKEKIKGITTIGLEKIKGKKMKINPISLNRKIDPLDIKIDRLDEEVNKLESMGLFYLANKKRLELEENEKKKNLEFRLETGFNIENPPEKLEDLLKIRKYDINFYTSLKYRNISPSLSFNFMNDEINLEAKKNFLKNKLSILAKNEYNFDRKDNYNKIVMNYKINPKLEFELETSYSWKIKKMGFNLNFVKEISKAKNFSFETSYRSDDEKEDEFLFLLKFKYLKL